MSHTFWGALALVFGASTASAAPQPLLAQLRDAAGGAAWDHVQGLQAQGRIVSSGLPGSWTRDEDLASGRWSARIDLGVYRAGEGDDGRQRWRQDPSGGVHPLDGAFSKQAAVTDAWLTRRGWLRRDRAGAQLAPAMTRDEDGRRYDVLEATPRGGQRVELWFDKRSHLLARTVREMPISIQTVRYADYRRVNGVQLPFRIESRDSSSDDVETVTVQQWRSARGLNFAVPTPPDDTTLQGTTQVPIETDAMVIVKATLNGRDFDFILDTGGHNILTPDAAKALALKAVGTGSSGGAGEATMAQQYTRVAELKIGDATMRDQHFYVLPLQYGTVERGPRAPLAGLLGLEIFERFHVRIDYPHRTLTLRKLQDGYRGAGTPVPITFDDDMPLVDGRLDGRPGVIALDTGNSGSSVIQGVWARREGVAERLRQGIETVSYGAGGASTNWAGRLQTLEIGGQVLQRPIVRLAEDRAGAFSSRTEAANIGTDVLRFFVIDTDYRAGVIWFDRQQGVVERPFNRAGVRASKDDAQSFVVAIVTPGTPAARAGLQRGDRIVAVDGVSAAQLSGQALSDKFVQPVGTEVALAVVHDGVQRELRLRLEELLP